MLGFDLSRPRDAGDGATAAVLLHGRGSHRGDLQALRPHVPADWVLLTPEAPHPGHPWGYGPGWAWYRYLGDDRVEEEGLADSLAAVDALLAELPALVGLRPGRLILGGFSQGGTVSLAYALTHPGAAAATLVFSGFLAATPSLGDDLLAAARTPIFWGHGTRDLNIPLKLAQRGRKRLAAAGVPMEARDYDIGHGIEPAEVGDAVAFVETHAG